jgi:hypothetical protein
LRENKEEKRSKEEKKSKEEKESKGEKENKREKENNGARKYEEGTVRARERKSYNKINMEQDQSIEILQDRTQSASDDHLDVLDVD